MHMTEDKLLNQAELCGFDHVCIIETDKLIIKEADAEDINEIKEYIKKFSSYFDKDYDKIIKSKYYVIIPNTKSPYKQLYTNH